MSKRTDPKLVTKTNRLYLKREGSPIYISNGNNTVNTKGSENCARKQTLYWQLTTGREQVDNRQQ